LLAPGAAMAQTTGEPQPVPRYWDLPFVGDGFLGFAVATIDNFTGFVASIGDMQGKGTDSAGNPLEWKADVRVMQGAYAAKDGVPRRGTFCFI
jgi:hypothetical protein